MARHTASARQLRQHGDKGGPESARCLDSLSYRRRHAFGINVDQRERRLVGLIGDVVAGAGDQIGPRGAVQLVFGDNLRPVRQIGPQHAERDGLVRC